MSWRLWCSYLKVSEWSSGGNVFDVQRGEGPGWLCLKDKINWLARNMIGLGRRFWSTYTFQHITLPLRSKLLLYKAYIRPMMTYTSSAWAFITKSKLNRLQVVQNRALRIIGGHDRYTHTEKMHFDHKIPMLKSYNKTLAFKLYASAKTSNNRYIRKTGLASKVVDPRVSRPSRSYVSSGVRSNISRHPKFHSFKVQLQSRQGFL